MSTVMINNPTDQTAEPTGTGWRAAAWIAFVVAGFFAIQALDTRAPDMVRAAVLVAAILLAMLLALLGIVFAVFGAAASANAGDRRPRVIAPVVANAGLLLWLIVVVFKP